MHKQHDEALPVEDDNFGILSIRKESELDDLLPTTVRYWQHMLLFCLLPFFLPFNIDRGHI